MAGPGAGAVGAGGAGCPTVCRTADVAAVAVLVRPEGLLSGKVGLDSPVKATSFDRPSVNENRISHLVSPGSRGV